MLPLLAAGRVKSGAAGKSGTALSTTTSASGAEGFSTEPAEESVVPVSWPQARAVKANAPISTVGASNLRLFEMFLMECSAKPFQEALFGCSWG